MDIKKYRVRTTPNGGDNHIIVDLKQSFDVLEILSLKINKSDFYKTFSSDYGVLVGRVNVNGGFGVPNAKVSIFIPISEEDKDDPKVEYIYPYESTNSVNENGMRYNLFTPTPEYPLGNFATKQEILDSTLMCEIYEKYYKYTTVTNESGDYMIFGVPVGLQVVHVDIDLSDIGSRSFTASDIIATGFPEAQFKTDGRGFYGFKVKNDLSTLPQIISQDMTVDIKPLWGDGQFEEIGITRYDFNSNLQVHNYATLAFSLAIDPQRHYKDKGILWEHDYEELGLYNASSDGMSNQNLPGRMDRIKPYVMNEENGVVFGSPTFKVYRKDDKGEVYEISDYGVVTPDKWDENGMLILKLPCYDNKFITDEFGNSVLSLDDSGVGTTGQYIVDVICDNMGYLEKGGEYYNFRLSDDIFTFDSNMIYTVAWRVTRNNGGFYGLRGFYGIFNTFIALLTNYGRGSGFTLQNNDWVNGLLYFGRMGNDPRNKYKEATIPTTLKRVIDGRNYYNVQTKYVNITKVYDTVIAKDIFADVDSLDSSQWKNPILTDDNIRPLIDRQGKNGGIKNPFFILYSYNDNIGNNFSRYKKNIV